MAVRIVWSRMGITDRLSAGEVLALGARSVRISSMSDGAICRDHRGRIAVRNVSTNRLSYIPEWALLKAKGVPVGLRRAAMIEDVEPLRTALLHVLGRYGIYPAAWHNQDGNQFMTDLISAAKGES